ncbi:MAG: IS630 family transposase [Robiginitomaculum sp.]
MYPKPKRVYLDESGLCHKLARTHAYGPSGLCIHGLTDGKRKGRTNIIGAWSSAFKLFATQTYEHTVNKSVFVNWIQTKLLPSLKTGMVVIMDNAPWHKGKDIRDMIESTGADLIMLPPYSPDLNPIEHAWANLKQDVKSNVHAYDTMQQNIKSQLKNMNHSIRN